MHRIGLRCVLAWALVLAIAGTARAQGRPGFGAEIGYVSPEGLAGAGLIGGHVELLEASRFHIVPSLHYWDTGSATDVNANLDGRYFLRPPAGAAPYLGGGFGVHSVDEPEGAHTETTLNLIAGVRYPSTASHYFLEGRVTTLGFSQFVVLAGATFHR